VKLYFDSNKRVYDFRQAGCVAEIDESVWSIYGRTEPGVGWDIVDGAFVPLITPEEIDRPIMDEQREIERKAVYEETEARLSQLEEQHVNEDISDQEYTERRKAIMAYRKNVRSTAKQSDYPFKVTYPDPPESDMRVIAGETCRPSTSVIGDEVFSSDISVTERESPNSDAPVTTDKATENVDADVNEVNKSESEPWI